MAVSDDDGSSERLAQTRAERRHLRRLSAGGRRDALHEAEAEHAAEAQRERDPQPDLIGAPAMPSADTRTLLLAEQAALELDRSQLVVDGDVDDDLDMGMSI